MFKSLTRPFSWPLTIAVILGTTLDLYAESDHASLAGWRAQVAEIRERMISGQARASLRQDPPPIAASEIHLIAASANGWPADVRVEGSRLFVASSVGLEIYEIADQPPLRWIGSCPLPMGAIAVDALGPFAAVVDLAGRWHLIDIRDPSRPARILTAKPDDPEAYDVAIGTTFVAILDQEGTRIFDIRGLAPREVRRIDKRGSICSVRTRLIFGDHSVLELADPRIPRAIASSSTSSPWSPLDAEGSLAVFGDPFEIWSIAGPKPQLLSKIDGRAWSVALDGDRVAAMMVSEGDFGMTVFDVREPARPRQVSFDDQWFFDFVETRGSRVYGGLGGAEHWHDENGAGVIVLDSRQPAEMPLLFETGAWNRRVYDTAVDWPWVATVGSPSRLFDFSDPRRPVEMEGPPLDSSWSDLRVAIDQRWLLVRGFKKNSNYAALYRIADGSDVIEVARFDRIRFAALADGLLVLARYETPDLEIWSLADDRPVVWPLVETSSRGYAKFSEGRRIYLLGWDALAPPYGQQFLDEVDLTDTSAPRTRRAYQGDLFYLMGVQSEYLVAGYDFCLAGTCICAREATNLADSASSPILELGVGCDAFRLAGELVLRTTSEIRPISLIARSLTEAKPWFDSIDLSTAGGAIAVDRERPLVVTTSPDQVRVFELTGELASRAEGN